MGHLISVNVGRPADLDTQWRTLRSAIVKAPAAGPVALGPDGLEGDEQADRRNHGGPYKAAYAYAIEDTAWWSKQLGRSLEPSIFGENLTLEGIDVSGARIGERWRIGAAEVQVSGPRVPCAKLGARIGDPRFPKRFVAAGRPGAYLSVTRAGTVQAGDVVEIAHRPEHDVTVADVLRIALLERSRLGELRPAVADFNPELRAWLLAA
jgi:MOSC domain-containing protein YiiM